MPFQITEMFSKDVWNVMKEIFSYLILIGGTYLVARLKKWIEVMRFKGKHNTQFLTDVYEQVVEIRKDYDSQRAFVLLRHNGTKLANNKGLDKVSMVYESADSYIKPIRTSEQAVPVHLFNNLINEIDELGGKVLLPEEMEESYLKRTMSVNQADLMILVPFKKAKRDIPEGYVGISFIGGKQIPNKREAEKILKELKVKANQIGYMLRR